MKEKLLFYYTNSKSLGFTLAILLMSVCSFAQNVNLAPQATASASTCNTGACSTLNDLNFGTCGTQQMWLTSNATNPGSAVFVQFNWTISQTIKGVTFHCGQAGSRYLGGGTLQAWDGATWNTITTFTQTNTALCNYDVNFLPITTTQLRLIDIVVIGTQTSNVNFREIEIWQGSIANNDIGVAAIDSPSTFCNNNQNVVARVVNFGKNQVTGFNINWSINGLVQTPISSTATLDTAGGVGAVSTQILLGSYNFPNNVLTQIKAWTYLPNNTNDTLRNNDTSTVNKAPAMAGNFTIGGVTGPNNYATIDAAISALGFAGVCGPVVFTIAPGTYNRTTAVVLGEIAGASNINTITFDGVNALNCRFTGAIPSSGLFILNASKFVTLRNITVENLSPTAPTAIALVGATSKITLSKCIARVPIILTGTSTTGYCINATGSVNGNGVSACAANNFTVDSCRTIGGAYGIVSYGSSIASANSGLSFTNNLIDSNNYMGMYIAYNYNPIVVSNNTINMQGWNYGYYGMYFYYNQSNNVTIPHVVSNNKINNFGYYGIYAYYPISTTTAAAPQFINNVISSFTGGSYSGFYGLYLYNYNVACRADIYHNTISMNGIQTSTTSSAFYSTGSNVLNVKNNIFAVYSGSSTPAYFATAPIANTVNYNLYWNATNTTTGNLVYRAAFYSPANFKTATAGGDTSYNENPSFVSRANNNFALTDGCNGFGFAGLAANDITGATRSLTTPSLGAYEFAGAVANNLAISRLLNPVSPITAGAQDLRFTIKNIGNNTVYSYNANYKLNNNTAVTQLMATNIIAPCGVDTALFTNTNQITLGAVNAITAYTSSPNTLVDADRTNDTLRASFYTPLSGTYTVGGTTPDFATIADAAAVLSNGVSGPVVFDIRPGTYTGQVKITGPVIGASSTNTITFQGNNKTTRIINANASGAPAFFIDKASYVTLRNLTINNTGVGQSSGVGVVGTATGNQGTQVNVINCNINVPIQTSTSSTGYGIIYTGTAGATGLTAMRADSVLVDSNTITGAGYTLAFYGASSSLYNRNNVFTNNTINNSNYMGAYIAYQYNPVVFDNNTINMQGENYGYYGLYFYYNQNSTVGVSSVITRNKVNNFGGMGIYCYWSTASATAGTTLIANNVINGNSTGTSYPGYYGIYVYNPAANPTNVFNNTVLMSGAGTSTTYTCFYNTTSTTTVVKNNIFIVTNGSYTPAYFNTNVTGNIVNYNQYWNATNTTTGTLIYRGTFYNPTNYKTATVGGDSSFNAPPTFVSANNLNITNGCLRGVNVGGLVNNDINGVLRATQPNLGAYEYLSTALDLQVEAMPYPTTPISLGAQNLAVRIRNNGGNTVTSFDVAYRLNNGTPVVQNWTGTLASCDTVTVVFSGANQINLGAAANNIKVYTYSPNFSADGNPGNDTLSTTLNPPMIGNYVIGNAPSDFTTISAATSAITNRGIAGAVTFNIKSGVYNEQVILPPAIGASAANTITFKSQANNADSVVINNSNLFVVRFMNNANHYIFDRVTMNQTNTTASGYTVLIDNNANFDTIKNCKVIAAAYDASFVTAVHYTVYTAAYVGNGLALLNNSFIGSYYGLRLYGSSRTAYHSNTVVSNNVFTNFYYTPFYYMYYSVGAKIVNNTYNPMLTGSSANYMYFYYNDSGFAYTNNVWNGNSSKALYQYMYYSNNAASNKSIVANNRIYGNNASYIYAGQTGTNNQDYVHNTFSTGTGYFYVGYNTTLQPSFRVMNNVFTSTGVNAYYFSAAPSSLFMTSDYNLVSSTGTTPYYATTNRSLPDFRITYPGLEGNSINYRAAINAATLAPVANDTAVWAINGRGNHIGYTLNDLNNVARPQTPVEGVPDLGAFEVTPTAMAPLATAIPATPVAGGTQVFLFGNDTVAKIVYDAAAAVPTTIGVRQYTGVRHPQAGVTQNYTNVYADITATGNGGYLFDALLYFNNPQLGTNPSKLDLRMARYGNAMWNNYSGTASSVDTSKNIITAAYIGDFGSFIGTDDLNPLPVILTTFVGKANNKNADLMWQTASEKNARLFEVYASIDGKIFKEVGSIKANGNTNVTSTYNFTDVNALANNNKVYYKLKSVDVDGSFEWSNIVIVSAKQANNNSIDIYPNPFNTNVTLSLVDNTPAIIEVVSMQGLSVYNATTNSNNLFVNVNLTQLTSGVYFIKVTQNGNTTVQKLVKQ